MWEEECGDVIHVCYECEKLGRVSADFTTGKSGNVVIFMDDGIKKLERDVSGSGARFTKADTEFWDKGGDARLTIGGSVYNCKMQKECR
jgi:membrane-bound inhibitor of C-type lysozyme